MPDMQKAEVSTNSQNKQLQSILMLLHQNVFIETPAAPHQDAKRKRKNCPACAALSHTDQFVLSEVVCGVEPSLITVPEASEIGWTCELLGE